MSDKQYLRPVGFVWGTAASEAVEQGLAVWIAGGPAACMAFELIQGKAGKAKRRLIGVSELIRTAEADLQALTDRLQRPRQAVAGIDLSRPRIMGIVNVTPDSFSDGGDFGTEQSAIAQAIKLVNEGADFVDIGGESTRPGAEAVDEAEEMRRVLPVIGGLRELDKPISVDTRKAQLMERAVAAGATMINDVAALTYESRALETAARLKVPVVLMHAQGDPRTMQENPVYEDVLIEVYDFLESRITAAESAGIPRHLILADPGIGFGKTLEHNLALLEGIGMFHGLGVPLLLGASRKRFIGTINGVSDARRRLPGSIGAALAGAAQGVQFLRVHDVDETRQALDCWLASVGAL